MLSEQQVLQAGRAVEGGPSGSLPDASIGVPLPLSLSRHAPTPSKFSSAKPMGSMREWQEAHTGLARCISIAWRIDILPSLPCGSSDGTFGGGGGGGVPRRFSRTHLPRCTTDVRFGYEVTVSRLPCPRTPPRFGIGQFDAAELRAVDAGHAVKLGKALIEKREFRVQQFGYRAVLAHDGVEEQLRFLFESAGADCCRTQGIHRGPASWSQDCADTNIVRRNCRCEGFGFRVVEHTGHLLLDDLSDLFSLPSSASFKSSSSGMLLQRKKERREASLDNC